MQKQDSDYLKFKQIIDIYCSKKERVVRQIRKIQMEITLLEKRRSVIQNEIHEIETRLNDFESDRTIEVNFKYSKLSSMKLVLKETNSRFSLNECAIKDKKCEVEELQKVIQTFDKRIEKLNEARKRL